MRSDRFSKASAVRTFLDRVDEPCCVDVAHDAVDTIAMAARAMVARLDMVGSTEGYDRNTTPKPFEVQRVLGKRQPSVQAEI